jgi:hypothetical protein
MVPPGATFADCCEAAAEEIQPLMNKISMPEAAA